MATRPSFARYCCTLIEEETIFRQDDRTSNLATEELGIPECVRQVIGSRKEAVSAALGERDGQMLLIGIGYGGRRCNLFSCASSNGT
jgi:hypothetical protein